MSFDPRDPSRYAGLESVVLTHTDGSNRVVFELRDPVEPGDLGEHRRTIVAARHVPLDLLAYDHLGDARLWWIVADLNRDVLDDMLRVPAGTELLLPTGEWIRSRGLG